MVGCFANPSSQLHHQHKMIPLKQFLTMNKQVIAENLAGWKKENFKVAGNECKERNL
jgi:hypothetical protein